MADKKPYVNYSGTPGEILDADALISAVASLVYGAGWDGNETPPTRNEVYDRIESLLLTNGVSTIPHEEGSALTFRNKMNFIGSAITASDNAGAGRTDITISDILNDIVDLSPAEGDVLVYNDTSNQWENVPQTSLQTLDIVRVDDKDEDLLIYKQFIEENNTVQRTFSLPTTAPQDSIFEVFAEGSGGIKIVQDADQQIHTASGSTTSGSSGYATIAQYGFVRFKTIVADQEFVVVQSNLVIGVT